ncbi:MAG: hypothetical protein ABW252_13225 [Polyangiales bacterium]
MRNLVLSSALLLVACSKNADAPQPSQSAASQAPSTTTPPAAEPSKPAIDPSAHLPAGHPPVGGGDQGAAPSAAATPPTGPASAGGLTWEAPAPLVRRTPKSSMRIAEYGLEDAPEAELTVFYFGADQGGTVDANMQRWIGQFSQPDGSETKAKRSEKKVKDIDVSLVEAKGVFSGGMAMPGAPAPANVPDAMLLGAIAKGPEGAVFFKFVGPREKLEKARPAFDGLLKSIKPAK